MQWSGAYTAAPGQANSESNHGGFMDHWASPSPVVEFAGHSSRDGSDHFTAMTNKLALHDHPPSAFDDNDDIIEITTNGAKFAEQNGYGGLADEGDEGEEHARVKRAQGPRGSSCSICRRGKRKCDEGRPCRRCVSKGPDAAAACAKEPTNRKEHVHRPEKYRQKSLHITASNASSFETPVHTMIPHKMLTQGLAHTTCATEWIDIFNNLTPKLHQTAMEILEMVYQSQIAMWGKSPSPPPRESSPESRESQTGEKRSGAHKWAESSRCGFISLEYSDTGQRDCVSVNKFGSVSLFGMHQEEALARLAQDELRLPTTQLRTFCLLFDGMLPGQPFKPQRYLVSTGKTGGSGGVIIRSGSKMEMDEGKMVAYTSTFTMLAAEEYDRAMEVQPGVGEELASLAVGQLSGSQILSSITLLHDEKFSTLRQTEQGRAGLDRLADFLREKFLPPATPSSSSAIRSLPLPLLAALLMSGSDTAHDTSPVSSSGGAIARSTSAESYSSGASGASGSG